MNQLRSFLARLKSPLIRERQDRDLALELGAHLQMLTDDNIRAGSSPEEARRQARIALGGIEAVKESCRDAWKLQFLHSLLHDVRYALRGMRRSPGFTIAAVIMLAAGIGVNAIVFSVTNAVLFKGFPLVDRNDRILYMTTGRGCCVSWPDFEDWRAQAKSFEGMALVHGVGMTFSDQSGFPERYDATEVSADTFKLAGRKPVLGRDFTPSDETPGAAPVAILSYGFWERRFGKDPAVIARDVRMNGALTTVVGVMPPGFSFPQNQDLWVPLVATPDVRKRENRNTWFAFGRLAEGVSPESARAEMETIGRRLGSAYPLTNQGRNLLPHVLNFREFFIGPNATMIYEAMWFAVGFVLLIACANLANLLLARATGRSREISLRIALGAGRWRIVRQLLIESVILSALGGFFGWWIAKWGVYALAPNGSAISDATPGTWFDHVLDYSMDYRVLAYLIAISLGTGLLFGLAPALRLSKLDFNTALKDGGRAATAGVRGSHLSAMLVIGEMALAVVLLAGAGVMIRSFLNVYGSESGFKPENILVALIGLPNVRYSSARAQTSFYESLKTRLEANPGVDSVATAEEIPGWGAALLPYEVDGSPGAPVGEDEQRRPLLSALVISPGYFRALGASMLSGREFNDFDNISGVPAVIVNRRFASRHWPRENPLGKRLRLFKGRTPEAWLTVVGVTADIAQNDAAQQQLDLVVYLPYKQRPTERVWVIARTRVPPNGLATAFRREVQALDSELPVLIGPIPLAERPAPSYRFRGFIVVLFLIFATVALLLASVGLYAVIAHSVSRRAQEMGIRMAIGATLRDILKLVFRQGMLPVGIGLILGVLASFAVNRVLKSELVRVSPGDPITLVVASGTLILAAMLGCLIPALRAARVDPMSSLRQE
jgi:putative ABC transport system permease protein